ncbi:hypothetical protein OESDEN_02247 [Oesophagostomum dentatum]|uniref:Uncharacterized protein n=1 Tax=Oesophagostomum dentatum TaxID=61180 RepID=A0A0B1TPM6_OESDE|nr:hypothetical protein OESDEN_02247 [Oesophagostomum dentatum]
METVVMLCILQFQTISRTLHTSEQRYMPCNTNIPVRYLPYGHTGDRNRCSHLCRYA